MALPPGTILEDRYRIESMLARGGMGAIYQGFDTNLNIPVAIKENFFKTPESIRQFQREAQILARMHHPNLPRVIQHFSREGQQYLVMDFIAGIDLWEMVKQQDRPLDEALALDYIIQVCDAVDYLHRQKPPVIHRDIKPQNIKITPEGQAVLVDFGIAKVAEGDDQTQTGAQGVTPGFSPPEQYSGEGTSPASDVFSLGATLYAVLTGQKPPNSVSLLVNRATFKSPVELNHNLSRQVSEAVMHAMQPRIADRPSSAAAWKRELESIINQPTLLDTPGSDATMLGQRATINWLAEVDNWLVGPGGLNYRLKLGEQTLGRSSSCDVPIHDRRASRRHATIRFNGRQCMVFDETSANGTFVNDQPVSEKGQYMKPGDRLRIGDTILTLSNAAGPSRPMARAGRPVDELARTAHIPEAALFRPDSTPTPTVAPAAPAPANNSMVMWIGAGMLVIIALLSSMAGYLYWQHATSTPTVAPGLAALIAAATTATAQAVAQEPTSDTIQATLQALAATATTQAKTASEVDTEATIAAAIAATDEARPTPTATDTPLPTTTPPAPTDTPTVAPTATNTPPLPTAAPVGAAAAPLGVFQGFETDNSWKRGDEPNGQLTRTSSQAHNGNYAGQISYNFATSGNDYVVFLQPRRLSGQPNAISAWVYGDGAGHFLNLWLKDAAGEVWQMSFGQEKHTGWKEMTAIISPDQPWPSGHISGPSNGVIDYPISFQGLVLDDANDNYQGQGTIYIDDLTSRELTVETEAATPTPGSSAGSGQPANVSPATTSSNYLLTVGGQHRYEPWGAPRNNDICESFRKKSFNDKIQMKGFNLELSLTNKSSQKVADNWSPVFITAQGKEVQACYYGYAGSGPPPNATASMTFFTIVAPDDYVRQVRLEINGEMLQICLDSSGTQSPC